MTLQEIFTKIDLIPILKTVFLGSTLFVVVVFIVGGIELFFENRRNKK